jgi:hypothetical protein
MPANGNARMSEPTVVTPNLIYLRSPGFGQSELIVQIWGQPSRIYRLEKRQLKRLAFESNDLHHKFGSDL